MTERPEVVYVVTDLPQILDQEKAIAEAILSRFNTQRPNLHFETANALDRESLSKVTHVFAPERPVAVITEGLLPYLNRDEKTTLANNIHDILGTYRGVWITSDVHTKQYREATYRLLGREQIRQRQNRISDSTGTNLENNFFTDDEDLRRFFDRAVFKIEEYQYSNMIHDLSSARRLNLNQEDMKRAFELLALSKTLILTLRNT
jgi:O-methyltransferase involved in polyketide biosynthesis